MLRVFPSGVLHFSLPFLSHSHLSPNTVGLASREESELQSLNHQEIGFKGNQQLKAEVPICKKGQGKQMGRVPHSVQLSRDL